VKLDAIGTIEWQKALGGSAFDELLCIRQTSDGGYIGTGRSRSTNGDVTGNHGNEDYWIVKLDAIGNISWQKCFGGSSADYGSEIQQTTDGGYIVAGFTLSNNGDVSGNHGLYDCWVIKLDGSGNISWQKCFGGSNNDTGYGIFQSSDGGYVVCGYSQSVDGDVQGGYSGRTAWIFKLDNSGTLVWQKTYGSRVSPFAEEEFFDIQQTSDSGYILAGRCEIDGSVVSGTHGDNDFWVMKIDGSGDMVWQKPLGGTGNDRAYSIKQTADGGYVVCGVTNSIDFDVIGNHGMDDAWVVKLSGTGMVEWQKCLGGTAGEGGLDIQQTTDGGFVIMSSADSNNDGDVGPNHGASDYWVVKLNAATVPVLLSQFQAALIGKSVLCKWQTEQEINSSHFEIERSTNGTDFTGIGRISAIGNTQTPSCYAFIDYNPHSTQKSILYYRLKMVDLDGSFSYSSIEPVILKYEPSFTISPNPVSDHLTVSYNSPTNENASVVIRDYSGRKIFAQAISIKKGNNSILINTGVLPTGGYIMNILGQNFNHSRSFIKTNP
jgi:hypothetical protein